MNGGSTRSFTATVVAVVEGSAGDAAADTLACLSKISGVRPVIVSLGDVREAPRREQDGAILIDGLVPRYLNNAVAALRLSSLPTFAWWRAGDPPALQDLASLVDRVVMDREEPSAGWALVPGIAQLASVSDMRWARLTRWRDLIAQFFDLPELRETPGAFERIEIVGTDPHGARLLGGWLKARLPGGERLAVSIDSGGGTRLRSVRIAGAGGSVSVRLLENGRCLETRADIQTGQASRRVVALGDQGLASLLREELRVRSRDLAFEAAVREAGQLTTLTNEEGSRD